ncbi:AAA family ATPase [Vagococcus teuberi]
MYFLQMSGVPGSGKSTLAEAISQEIDFIIVDHDTTKTVLLEQITDSLSHGAIGQLSYHLDWKIIESLLAQGKNIIFDSPCLYDEIIEKGILLSDKYGFKYKYVECINKDFEDISRRLYYRENKLSQIEKYESHEVFLRALKGSKKPQGNNFIEVDTSKNLNTYLEDVLNYIYE